MATIASAVRDRTKPLAPDRYEKFLAVASLVLLGFVLAAVLRGHAHWYEAPPLIWLHLLTMVTALALTPVILLRRRGDRVHRRLGWVWSLCLFATALLSFGIRAINPGHFSYIHLLSAFVLTQIPLIIWSARTHNVRRHRLAVRGMATGALLIAGFFTFPFGRLLGHWLFS